MDFPTIYQELIYKSRYARWNEELGRRENWWESIFRYSTFMAQRVPEEHRIEYLKACTAIGRLEVMPSMRALWTAGPALEADNIAGYNCAYLTINDPKSFADLLYILMNGTGVGFSVEWRFINCLPEVPRKLENNYEKGVVFQDSKLGWAKGYYELLKLLYKGIIPVYDLKKIRPAGAKLKTFGGRASGPEPLRKLLNFTIDTFREAAGRKLTPLECHDLCCMIGTCVVSGGVRRSALISLSDLHDEEMRHAKDASALFFPSGRTRHEHRFLSNNSAVYNEEPDTATFLKEMAALIESDTGERGIVNRDALVMQAEACGREVRYDYGLNPCGEVILRPEEFCNLTEVVLRKDDTFEDMIRKVRWATILGVVQSTLTDFKFIDKGWKANCEEERLLGVSLTGLCDCDMTRPEMSIYRSLLSNTLTKLKQVAHNTAKEWAGILGINTPKAVTCVKPSGTVSQLVDSSSGIHQRFSPYYMRRIRMSVTDPITAFLKDKGCRWYPEVGQTEENCNTAVFEFPVKSPAGAQGKLSAIDQLEYWHTIKTAWCDHNPSATIYVKEDEWMDVVKWIHKNWDDVAGLAFLPFDGGVYELAPYQEISEERYLAELEVLPEIDFSELVYFEKEDKTEGSHEFACMGSSCDLV